MPDLSSSPPRRRIAANTIGPGFQMIQGAIIAVAVLYFARDLLIPLALAVLLSFVLAPLVRVLSRISVPRVPAVLIVVLIGFVVISGIGTLMVRQAGSLAENLPAYQATITEKVEGLRNFGGLLDRLGGLMNGFSRPSNTQANSPAPTTHPANPANPLSPTAPNQQPVPVEIHQPGPTPIEVLQRLAEPLLGPLATSGIVLILVIFILLYREDLRDRVIRLAGARDLHRTMAAMDDAAYRLSRFFLAQTTMNVCYGLYISVALWVIGIPNPILWGIIAGLMRFVPFIGNFIAAAFPALLALAVDPGWATLLWVLALFIVSELMMGQVFEPLIFGHSTGLSPIAVIAAATFWTWLWGPIGLLLAVPLTVCLVVLGRHVERLEFLEVMLGDQPALEPEEIFYQRALAGDADALAEQADRCLDEEKSLTAYLDSVALPALQLAQADAARGTLARNRLETLERSVLTLIEDLEEAEEAKPEQEPSPLPAPWQAPGAVLCIPGRGPLDRLVTAMLREALTRRGFGVQTGHASAGPAAPPRLLCLCLLEGGSNAVAARYLLRRTRRRLPGVQALALVWSAEASDGSLMAMLRAEGKSAPLLMARSLAEAVELAAKAAGTEAGPVLTTPAPQPEPPLGATPAPA